MTTSGRVLSSTGASGAQSRRSSVVLLLCLSRSGRAEERTTTGINHGGYHRSTHLFVWQVKFFEP
jgi:hypothetical protein